MLYLLYFFWVGIHLKREIHRLEHTSGFSQTLDRLSTDHFVTKKGELCQANKWLDWIVTG